MEALDLGDRVASVLRAYGDFNTPSHRRLRRAWDEVDEVDERGQVQ